MFLIFGNREVVAFKIPFDNPSVVGDEFIPILRYFFHCVHLFNHEPTEAESASQFPTKSFRF